MGAKIYWRPIYVAFVAIFIFWTHTAKAANTFEDPQGRFAIDLPSGWELDPQTDETVFVFKGDSKSIIIQYFAFHYFTSDLNNFFIVWKILRRNAFTAFFTRIRYHHV